MKIAIVMPTMRWKNWPEIRKNIGALKTTPEMSVTWFPVMFRDEWPLLMDGGGDCIRALEAGWISPLLFSGSKSHPWPRLMNCALDFLALMKFYGWVWPLSDDDLAPAGFLNSIAAAASDPTAGAIVASLLRGQSSAASGHGVETLVAEPSAMRPCGVNASQVIWHTRFDLRYVETCGADGILAGKLHGDSPEAFRFLSDVFLPFNALEPGRWDSEKLAAALNM